MFILFAERKVGEQHGPAAQGVLAAVQTLREMNADNLRKVPADAPTAFIKPRWKPLVITPEGLDRKFYEICALSELKNALRSGDIWVKGSRQFRDFDDYLLPAEKFAALKREQALPLAINPNSDQGTVAKLAMRQPFVLFKGLTFQKLCLPGAFRPGDHHNKMLRPGLCVVHASPQYL